MVRAILFTVAFDLLAAAHAAPSWSIGQEVNTTSGLYTGHDSKLRPGVSEYLGIKYGQETSGAGRFAKPVALVSKAKLGAHKYSDDCPGILSKIYGPMAQVAAAAGALNPASEDCLAVNVWTKPQVGEKKKVNRKMEPSNTYN
jgi:cholinesterase